MGRVDHRRRSASIPTSDLVDRLSSSVAWPRRRRRSTLHARLPVDVVIPGTRPCSGRSRIASTRDGPSQQSFSSTKTCRVASLRPVIRSTGGAATCSASFDPGGTWWSSTKPCRAAVRRPARRAPIPVGLGGARRRRPASCDHESSGQQAVRRPARQAPIPRGTDSSSSTTTDRAAVLQPRAIRATHGRTRIRVGPEAIQLSEPVGSTISSMRAGRRICSANLGPAWDPAIVFDTNPPSPIAFATAGIMRVRRSAALRYRHASFHDHHSSRVTLFYDFLFDGYRGALTCALRDRTICGANNLVAAALRRSWRVLAFLDEE